MNFHGLVFPLVKNALTASELADAKPADNPTEAQKKSGNYKKGHINWKGLSIAVENAKGRYRSGVSKSGKEWKTLMKDAYGYIKRTESEADGDHIDVFVCDEYLDSEVVFIVNQIKPDSGDFDEHKCVLGAISAKMAEGVYRRNYDRFWKGFGSIAAMTVNQFKHWITEGDTSKPVVEEAISQFKTAADAVEPHVVIVDDERIRNLSLRLEEFGGFATHLQFPEYIPHNEIWIARSTDPAERQFYYDNALAQLRAAANGATTDAAYQAGIAKERAEREKVEGVKKHPQDTNAPADPKVYVGDYATSGPVKIKLVDERMVRDLYRTAFVEGGNGYVYSFIPNDEVWIGSTLHDDEKPKVAFHELHERYLIKQLGFSYDHAHMLASRAEFKLRKQAEDPLNEIRDELDIEHALVEAEEEQEKRLGIPPKVAEAYHLTGDVQGVHLRKTLHKLLDKYKAEGLAYNNARTGDVYATINADPTVRQKILDELGSYLKSSPRVHHYEIEPGKNKEKLKHINLSDQMLHRMFQRQGFTEYVGYEHDPAAYRRHWVGKRYRLGEDPKNHHLTGDVPELAYRQLMGLEPVYDTQIAHPEQFAAQYWNKHLPPGPAIHPEDLPIPTPDIMPEKLGYDCYPTIFRLKHAKDDDGPFTIAVDLDGTLAEIQDPFDAKTIGKPREGAKKWLEEFHDAGARLIINTVRGDTELVREWLEQHKMPFDYINENPDQPEDASEKILAHVYWDDRAVNAEDLDVSGAEIMQRMDDKQEKDPVRLVVERTTIRILLAPEDIMEELLDREVAE
jgi:acylphosphatase